MEGEQGIMVSEELIKSAFGVVVREKRLLRDVTQAELAGVIGISRPTLIEIEQGKKNPKLTDILKLSVALDIDLAPFVDMVDCHKVDRFVAAQYS